MLEKVHRILHMAEAKQALKSRDGIRGIRLVCVVTLHGLRESSLEVAREVCYRPVLTPACDAGTSAVLCQRPRMNLHRAILRLSQGLAHCDGF